MSRIFMERKYFAYAKKIEEDFFKISFWKNNQRRKISIFMPVL